jgi:hypothetical protein
MQLQAISLGFYTDAQWTSFASFCQRCYSSLTELLTEMGHYTEAIKRYLTIGCLDISWLKDIKWLTTRTVYLNQSTLIYVGTPILQ